MSNWVARELSGGAKAICAFRGLLVALTLQLGSYDALAGTVQIPTSLGGPFAVPAVSLKESHFQSTIRQQYDFSCGSAALSTLLTYHYDYPVSEQAVFEEMFRNGDQRRIQRAGFSLLDIKRYLENHGFQANGYEAPLEKLVSAKVPALVLINQRGYHHFVVIKGMRADRVLIGDPSGGTRAVPIDAFKAAWTNNILFVITNKTDVAKFNVASDWRAAPLSPMADGINRQSLYGMVIPKFGSSDF